MNEQLIYMDQQFYHQIQALMNNAKQHIYQTANFTMVKTYWEISRMIVEKQGGDKRTEYGKGLIKELSLQMTKDYGKGYSTRNLRSMRDFYLTFPIWQSVTAKLSWSHYCLLLKVKNKAAIDFYIQETINGHWSTRQLERQINSQYYERMILSSDQEGLRKDTNQLERPMQPSDIIKGTYILEFLGLDEMTKFHESDLEQAIIDHLQKFLLELGNGFCFVARQKRITLGEDNFYIDLIFYNIPLRCYVLIDLKTGKLTHQDIGQMQMYVHYYEKELKNEGDNPPIGIILCTDKNQLVVRYTLPKEEKQIYASKYQTYLPTQEQFQKLIDERINNT